MKYVATFEHGRQSWCVQLIEQGPCPVMEYCDNKETAVVRAEKYNRCAARGGLYMKDMQSFMDSLEAES